jgi:ATP-dependent Lon protease
MNLDDLLNVDRLSQGNIINEDTEFIPLVTSESDIDWNEDELTEDLPILPLRNTVVFPGVVAPITAGRDKSVSLINDAQKGNKIIGVISQVNPDIENPGADDIYKVGTLAKIVRSFKMPDGNTTIIIQGKRRFVIKEWVSDQPYLRAKIELLEDIDAKANNKKFAGLIGSVKDLALKIIQESPHIPSEAQFAINNITSDKFLINFISSNLNIDVAGKQELLELADLTERANLVLKHLMRELQMLEVKNEIQSKVKTEFDNQQREYFLQQQMKTIQEELGGNNVEVELDDMRKRAAKKKWSENVHEHFEKELSKLQRLNQQMPEFSVQRNYLELMLDLPWDQFSKDKFDLKRAKRILDRDHFGLDDVKNRIIEYLAVLKLKGDMKSPILCLYGPPGVGKTSLGKSIAEAVGRKYIRMSLGGLRDEAEIRGHRKTYIGAMPGRVLQNIKKAETGNPVFVLDEIDKISYGGQGDPSSAMLEVLDPEQNNEFYDNYLEMGYDLSKVMFIATANNLQSIQPALRDRMEIIEINGYTLEEKVQIAKKHLLPKQLREHGMKPDQLKLGKAQLEAVIDGYTRESGVRGLEKMIAKLVRHGAKSLAMEEEYNVAMTVDEVRTVLGAARFDRNREQSNEVAGVVTGLAWTPVGGDILFIESSLSRGTGKLAITGNLGDVMKESATIALAYIKSHAEELNIPIDVFKHWDINIHVPEGATPKDGPSAGVTMLTALTSLYTQRKVRNKMAMTGEITLRGKVLPVGGIKEKILAAKRAGVKEIILCEDNRKDIEEISANYLKGLTFHYVSKMMDVLEVGLLNQKVTNARNLKVKEPIKSELKQA